MRPFLTNLQAVKSCLRPVRTQHQPSGAVSDQDLPQHDPDPPYYREVSLSDMPSQYAEEVDTFRRILSLPDPRESMPRSSTSVMGLDDEKGRQELRPRGPSSILPLSSVIKDAFDKFQHDFKAANLPEGKYVKPPPSTSKWYRVGQPCFQDKIQELNTDFAKICITPKPSGAPMGKVPLPVLKELEHQARQNISTLNFTTAFAKTSSSCNASLEKCQHSIKSTVKKIKSQCDIRSHTISYASKKAKQDKNYETELTKKLNHLEQNLKSDNKESYTTYLQCKEEWESLIRKKNNGIIFRSKARWVEDGEKNTKYFLNLEKRNCNNKCIRKLITKEDKELTSLEDIIEEEVLFYKTLYTTTGMNSVGSQEKFLKNNIPKLNESDRLKCDKMLSLEECTKALKLLPNNKSPGSDGFTTNFYKFFWIDLKELLFDSFQYSFQNNTLSEEQKRGVINLIPKSNKDVRFLSN